MVKKASKKVSKKKASSKSEPEETGLVEKDESALSTETQALIDECDDDDGLQAMVATDLVLSRCLLMQPMSGYVSEGKARPGEIVCSKTGEVLCEKGALMEFIPLYAFKTYRLFKPNPDGGKPIYVTELPYGTEQGEWEVKKLRNVTIDGEELMCYLTWNFYILLEQDIRDPEGMPRLLSFTSTSLRAGKELCNQIAAAKKAKTKMFAKTHKVTTKFVENDKGKFYVFDVSKGRLALGEEVDQTAPWHLEVKKGFKNNTLKVDAVEKDVGGETMDTTAAPVSAAEAAATDQF